MPEGHVIHRLARFFENNFRGFPLRVSSPQGRFSAGAALLDGEYLVSAEAIGKHLLLGFAADPQALSGHWLQVHLGIYGAWRFNGVKDLDLVFETGRKTKPRQEFATKPAAGANTRVRLEFAEVVADLSGPTTCQVINMAEVEALFSRIGPDPLRDDSDPEMFFERVRKSNRNIGQLLMDQSIISGVGNIYRAETLFRQRVNPLRAGRLVSVQRLQRLWDDLVILLAAGVKAGQIVTLDEALDLVEKQDPLGEWEREFYVYHRTGDPCRFCSTPIRHQVLSGRNLFWCPSCQRY